MGLESKDPTTGRSFAQYTEMSDREVGDLLTSVVAAFDSWRRTPIWERVAALNALEGALGRRSSELRSLATREMGKTAREGAAEIEKCRWAARFYAESGPAWLEDEPVVTESSRSFVTYQPLGPVLAIMPWNFPFWQVVRCAVPILLAGNGFVLKHASSVTGCALALESVFREAGIPSDLFRALRLPGDRVARVLADDAIRGVTFTGSTPAGRAVAAEAGRSLKKSVLELGGSDPYVVLADADISLAADVCAKSRLINAGQSCVAAKRFIVVEDVREAFERALVARFASVRIGDPADPSTDMGPLARIDLRDEVHDQVQRSVAAGARLLLGGEIPRSDGAFYPPTLLTDVRPGMAAHDEEVFGPVAAIEPVADDAAALRVANASGFGLGAAIFTADVARGTALARDFLDVGAVAVNDFVRSDPRLPFGGVKQSGYGRELGLSGLREFVNVKSVVVR